MPADYPPPHQQPEKLEETKFRPSYAARVEAGDTRFLSAFTHEQAILKRMDTLENFKEQFAPSVIAINRQMEAFNLDKLDPRQQSKVTMLPELFELIISKIRQFGNEADHSAQIANQDMRDWLDILAGFATRYEETLDNESRDQLQAAIDVLQAYFQIKPRIEVKRPKSILDEGTEVEQKFAQLLTRAEALTTLNLELPSLFPNIEALISSLKQMPGRDKFKIHLIQQLEKALTEAEQYFEAKSQDTQNFGPEPGLLSRLKR